MSPAKKFKS